MFRYVELEISWAKPIQEENIQHCNILQTDGTVCNSRYGRDLCISEEANSVDVHKIQKHFYQGISMKFLRVSIK